MALGIGRLLIGLLLTLSSCAAAFLANAAAPTRSRHHLLSPCARPSPCRIHASASADHYAVLGVDRSATAADIKRAYRRLALKNHPDVNKAPDAQDKFARIAEAYSVLSDDTQRAAYNNQRGRQPAGARGSSGTGGAYARPRSGAPGGSSARAASAERARRAREEEDLASGDSFGALFSDIASTLLGGEQGWLDLLEGMSDYDGDLGEVISSRDVSMLEDELESAKFVQQTLHQRLTGLSTELKQAETEVKVWARRAEDSPPASLARTMEREFRAEARNAREREDNARRMLLRVQERERRIVARLADLRARGGAAPPRPPPAAPRQAPRPAGSRRRASVEEELERMKREMGK